MSDTISRQSSDAYEEAAAHWTEKRMAAAKPKPLPELSAEDLRAQSEEGREPREAAVTPPDTSLGLFVEQDAMLAAPVAHPAAAPYRCNGKLFFKWRGEDYVGSAGSIFNEVILTAGHNVCDEGEWSSHFLFWPGYPVINKSWGWTRASVFRKWKEDANLAYDYAMIMVDRSMEEIGAMGTVRDLSPVDRAWTAYGYPSEDPYPGDQMYEATGSYVSGAGVIKMNNNDMTRGASGGNWVTNYGGEYLVNGVNSHRGAGEHTMMRSPFLRDVDFQKLLDCVSRDDCQ